MDILNRDSSVFDRLGTTNPINVIEKKRNKLSCSYLNPTKKPHQGHRFKPPLPPPRVLLPQQKLCNHWIQGKCDYGDKCRFLHRWCTGRGFILSRQLPRHNNYPITAITYPIGSSDRNKVYSGSKDGIVRVWDCQSGKCVGVVKLGAEIGCMISQGEWVFVGIRNSVKALNTNNTNTHLSLSGPVGGQVHALAIGNHMLFAGTQDGAVSVWLLEEDSNSFRPMTTLKGHNSAVVSLIISLANDQIKRLYSGSMDNTIRVWNLLTMECFQVLSEHTSAVTSVLCWDQYLISCSLDQTIKVWGGTDEGRVELVYNHKQQHGLLALCGVHDLQAKPLLMCSTHDNVLHLYDLPTFQERGKIFSNKEIKAIEIGSGGLFFTGDGTGLLSVWKLSNKASDL